MEDVALHKLKARLDQVTAEMTALIRQYGCRQTRRCR